MPVTDLLRQLSPSSLAADEREVTSDWVRRRVRALIAADATIKDPSNAKDITAAATPAALATLQAELTKVRTAYATIWGRVKVDTALLSLDRATIAKTVTIFTLIKAPASLRPRMVRCIVYQAIAADQTLADPANIERLYLLCDRRLRITEQMLYRVGAGVGRHWDAKAIAAAPGGEWKDGSSRMFEYPRIWQSVFLAPCKPDQSGVCSAPMQDWVRRGGTYLFHRVSANATAAPAWPANPSEDYELDYSTGSFPDAVSAINALFTPETDYKQRNLFFCDHTIHALHLEALVFSRAKRGQAAAWLETELTGKPPHWLRLRAPMASKSADFLASIGTPSHFAFDQNVHPGDLQIGDHLIIFNHPAYGAATHTGVWKLENAVVVQTVPSLLMQGHGSTIYDLAYAKQNMLRLFNNEVAGRRANVLWQPSIRGRGMNPDGSSWIDLDTSERPFVGMSIDIVNPADGSIISANCPVAKVETVRASSGAWHKRVTHVGVPVPAGAPSALAVRFARRKFGALTAIFNGEIAIVQRVDPSASNYKGIHRRADWHLAWDANPDETAAAADAARAALIKQKQYVDYTVIGAKTIGWFPLWRPKLKPDGTTYTSGGKIVATEENVLGVDAVAGWEWLVMRDPSVPVTKPQKVADEELYNVPVLRPAEP
ncbi:MAG: hypothetical protein ACXVY8_06955 [Gaiellaceae bacterium]